MKLVVLPDLHYGITPLVECRKIFSLMKKEQADLYVLAGDVAETYPKFRYILDMCFDLPATVAVIPGNHDLWNADGMALSENRWRYLLPKAVRERGFLWLQEDDFYFNGTAVLGSIGWYDYSARPAELLGKSEQSFFDTKRFYVKDGDYIDWKWTDIEFARMCEDDLKRRLENNQKNTKVSKIVVITHVPVFKEQRSVAIRWNRRAEVYYGNLNMGRMIEKFNKVKIVISGHVHESLESYRFSDNQRQIRCVLVGSDYGCPQYYSEIL